MINKKIIILGIGSDIGKELALRYVSQKNTTVIGIYRQEESIKSIQKNKKIRFFKCDVLDKVAIKKTVMKYGKLNMKWDILISCIGTLAPIGQFFETEFDKWQDSFTANSISQMHFLHSIYPYRNKNKISQVVFFAGGGTNSTLKSYSAYCASKIMLIKMCELLDDENKDLNVFIVGPGWVRTKILNQTLEGPLKTGDIYKRTQQFLKSGSTGTSYDDIYKCINWCISHGKKVVGGRNLSVVDDGWRNGGKVLAEKLTRNYDKFKLRRFQNTKKRG